MADTTQRTEEAVPQDTVQQAEEPVPQHTEGEKRPAEDAGDEAATEKPGEDGAKKARPNNWGTQNPPGSSNRAPKRKIAMLLSFCGSEYQGMQRNPGARTIEEELRVAFQKAGVVSEDNAECLSKVKFQRTARTDKGVSAAAQVVSFKAVIVDNMIEEINKHLPEDIRAMGYRRTTGQFNCKLWCSARQYDYIIPTYCFAPSWEETTPEYRITPEVVEKVRATLKQYEGTHNYHNYTSGKKFADPSAKRFIMYFQCGEPFLSGETEMLKLSVKGQSFMLHQIRKMVGLTVAIVRGLAPEGTMERSFEAGLVDVPKVPGLGLVLEKVFFDSYNKKFAGKELLWEEETAAVEQFKKDHIYKEIARVEHDTRVFLEWLPTLRHHTYDGQRSGPRGGKDSDDEDNGNTSD